MYGQETYKEVKSLTKSISYEAGEVIDISGERTFINIQVADQPDVSAEVEIIARYKEQNQAQDDLEKIQVVFEKRGNTIYFSNAIQIQDIADKPKSNIKTILNLKIPKYASVDIKNAFGDITIKGRIDKVNLESQFCTIEFTDYIGKLTMESKYDECKIINSKGSFNIDSDKSDLSLDKVSGKVKADANFGKLDIIYGDNPITYDIKSEYTPTSIYLSPRLDIFHDYTCKKCQLITEYCDENVSREASGKVNKLTIGSPSNSVSTIVAQSEDINIISINTQANNK
jgi:hypothetical protein